MATKKPTKKKTVRKSAHQVRFEELLKKAVGVVLPKK
jgi:hypothetical protein